MKEKLKIFDKNKGITLIALVITIVVLLILAGITIGAITGDNGIINKTRQAKEDAEIANEKEIIDTSTVEAMGKNKRGNLEEDEFQSAIAKHTDGKVEVTDIGEEFEVYFTETNRYYMVDKDGNIGEAQEVIKDQYPGDITVGKDGEQLDGSEDHPYEINCIEDLVVLSNITRGKGNYLENGEVKDAEKNVFASKNIILTRTLNFNSSLSYSNLSIGWKYDETEESYIIDENSISNLRELLIDRNGVGFVPISEETGSSQLKFQGNFNGQGFEIQNLYENTKSTGGLFRSIRSGKIENLGLTNVNIIATGGAAGVVNSSEGSKFYNIYVTGNVYSNSRVGGIVQFTTVGAEIINCCNLARIESKQSAGGIIGYSDIYTTINIINCYNAGEVLGNGMDSLYNATSGIIGGAYSNRNKKYYKYM